MRRLALILLLFFPVVLFPQAARWDAPPLSTIVNNPAPGSYPPMLAVPAVPVQFCAYPAVGNPCTNLITTYTDATLTNACPSSRQITYGGSNVCWGKTDNQGNFGIWWNAATSPHITYTLQTAYGSFGPYDISGSAPPNATYVQKAGDTMTGSLILPSTPAPTGQAAVSAAYLQARAGLSVADYGAVADGKGNASGSVTSGSAIVNIPLTGGTLFSAGDVGKIIQVNQLTPQTTILSVNSPTQVTMAANATGTGTAQTWWGTDNTAAFNQALTGPSGTWTVPGGIFVYVPAGSYVFSGPIFVRGGEVLAGAMQSSSQITCIGCNTVVNGTKPFIQVGTNSSGVQDNSGLQTGVLNLFVTNSAQAGSECMQFSGVLGFVVSGNVFESCNIGLNIPGSNPSNIGTITANVFDSSVLTDIIMSGSNTANNNGTAYMNIFGNQFFNPHYSAVAMHGVTDVNIYGNQFISSGSYEIDDDQSGSNDYRIQIIGNNFRNAGNTAICWTGISTGGGLQNSIISKNVFFGSVVHDIYLNGSATAENLISENTFNNSSTNSTAASPQASIYTDWGSASTFGVITDNIFNSLVGNAVLLGNAGPAGAWIIKNNVINGIYSGGVPSSGAGAFVVTSNSATYIRSNYGTIGTSPIVYGYNASTNTFGNIGSGSVDVAGTFTTTGGERAGGNSGANVLSTGSTSATGTCTLSGYVPGNAGSSAVHFAVCQ